MALQQIGQLALIHRCEFSASPLLLFYQPSCLGRCIEKQHLPGFRASADIDRVV
jgi:hypothetical protein